MKFIKTYGGAYINDKGAYSDDGGAYINVDIIKRFGVKVNFTKNVACVHAYPQLDGNQSFILARFINDPKSTTQFDPEEAAQAWLDNLIAELNE